MNYRLLANSGIKVSQICLGSMTWGNQNSQSEAFEQLDYALEQGINFVDTAELYAIPPEPSTYGATETIIGNWLKQTGKRNDIILASKVCGPTAWCPHIRKGEARLDRKNIFSAVEGSLQRLQTDYLDLYQVHWPERKTNYFGKLGYEENGADHSTPIDETLAALGDLVKEGKVRHIGISNETPWGVTQYLNSAREQHLPRILSIQNPYNLLNRSFEVGLAEISHREKVGLLAYSPLGFGTLSGKYLGGQHPEKGRITLFPHYQRYSTEQGSKAIKAYVALAREHGLDPAQMALSFVHSRPFVTSTIIGATTMEQLHCNIASVEIDLSEELIQAIHDIHQTFPNPCP
jgi:aryl-alcohol dehydrogenase-like predicted oxidoreductase